MRFARSAVMVMSLGMAPLMVAQAQSPSGSAAPRSGTGTGAGTATSPSATGSTNVGSSAGTGMTGSGAPRGTTMGGTAGTATTGTTAGSGAMGASGAPAMTADLAAASDAEVLAYIHQVNQSEIDAGKMAKANGQSKKVKDYGDRLVKEHTKADKQLNDFAKKEKVTLAESTTLPAGVQGELATAKEEMQRLSTLKGAEFDTAFLAAQASMHDKVAQKLSAVHDTKKDSKLGKLVGQLLPSMKQHGEAATKLQTSATH